MTTTETSSATTARPQVGPAFPSAFADLLKLAGSTRRAALDAGLDSAVLALVKIRASQLNACSFCLDMHTREATEAGESDRRLHLVAAWRETTLFTPVERAALELTEVLTRLSETRDVPDAVYDEVRRNLDETQYAAVVYTIGMINFFNRLAVAGHAPLPDAG